MPDQPAEHCGHQSATLATHPTECVLRPGHSGSHADETGMRWWRTAPATIAALADADAGLAVRDRRMEQLAAGRETWKRKALEMEADRDQADAAIERVREAVHIADDEDVTEWQRGYRACAARILAALDPQEQPDA